MGHRWFPRKSHPRRLASGKVTSVCGTIVCRGFDEKSKKHSYRHPCPHCGAQIVSIHMRNGGWAHFEGKQGLSRTKHSCLHLGEGLGRRRDNLTADLFDQQIQA
ncbi:hypothetical protein RJJ65_18990 [Rhizobium hidalgonense]|uniref:Uncharacterized protein n=1 Tax=Rhizobium hidalgonense TaxID=1538159 RepID=A0AAJ2LN79_9HYPH|nr:hypothetical protein [Rhizobium hidalgonense]MDR9774706.1 hypothetical protein [Rhizobium hidalgonense]MDR9809685.1 hypothetical protein [Rhizobium hidalgonense]MDR9818319.1 hypothetical protein [Rhizobium hidalgonense]